MVAAPSIAAAVLAPDPSAARGDGSLAAGKSSSWHCDLCQAVRAAAADAGGHAWGHRLTPCRRRRAGCPSAASGGAALLRVTDHRGGSGARGGAKPHASSAKPIPSARNKKRSDGDARANTNIHPRSERPPRANSRNLVGRLLYVAFPI